MGFSTLKFCPSPTIDANFARVSNASDKPLSFHIDVLFPRVEVPLLVLKLLLEVRLESAFEILSQDLLVELEGMLDLCDVFEVDRVGDAEALHLVGVAPLLEMLFEGATAPVAGTPADLTLELLAQAVQFEEPVGDWLTVPAHWQVLWVVLHLVFVVVGVLCCHLVRQQLLRIHRVLLCLNL